MAFSLVSSIEWKPGSNGGTSSAVDTTGADLLVVSVSWYAGGGAAPTVTDSKGNTWTGLTSRVLGTIGQRLFYAKNPTVGTGHTFTASGTAFYPWCSALAYSGADLTAPFDVENGATTTAASPLATGSITPAQNLSLIISGWAGMNGTSAPTVGAGLSIRQLENPIGSTSVAGAVADRVQPTAAASNPSWAWTGTDNVAVSVAAFKPAAGTPASRVAAVSYGHTTGSAASLTFSHTATGDPLYVAVGQFVGPVVTTVTYGGTTLTPLRMRKLGDYTQSWYVLAAPTPGTANVVVTPTGSASLHAAAWSVSGGRTDFLVREVAVASGSGTTPSVTVPSATGDVVLDLVTSDGITQVFTASAGQTGWYAENGVNTSDTKGAGSSKAGAASVTPAWTLSVSDNWTVSALSIPAAASALVPHRIQGTPKVSVSNNLTAAMTFAAPPTVGNGVIVLVIAWGGAATISCADNRSNSYSEAIRRTNGNPQAALYYCTIATTGSPFTITLTGASSLYWIVGAIEVGGVPLGLQLDQAAGATGTSAAPATGSTAALAGGDVLLAAVHAINTAQSSITVGAATPAWLEEYEELPFSIVPGESDSQRVSGASGTTPSCSWTDSSSAAWAAVVAAFMATAGPPPAGNDARLSQALIELLSEPTPDPRITQSVIEALSLPAAISRITQNVIEVLIHALPPEQTFEDGGVSHPLTWITLTKKDGTKHPYSEVDLNDPEGYYDGYKRPRVERFLTIARGLSDRDGQIEHMSFGATFSDMATDRFDTDREFRGMLADPVNKYLTNRPLEVWFVDDTERRRLGRPRLAAVGYVNDYAPTADLHFEVKGADWLKKKFSRKRRAQQGWQPLITAADFPGCPEETLNSPAPLIYGSLGLSGADAVVGVTITVNPQPTAAPGSFALSLQPGGRLAGITRYYIVAGIVGGQETVQAGPLSATTTDTDQTIRLTWSTVPSATAIYVYSSHRPDFRQFAYTVLAGSATSYDDTTTPPNQDVNWLEGTDWILGLRINLKYYVYANLGGGLFSAPGSAETYLAPFPPEQSIRDRDIDVAWTAHAGATGGYRVIRWRSYYTDWDPQFDRQWDPAAGVLTVTDDIATTTAVTIPSGELIAVAAAGQSEAIFVGLGTYGTSPITVSAFLIARHACARVGSVYVPSTTENVGGETATTYAPVPESAFGVTWFAPDHPGWIYPNKYVEINGKWFTLIFTTVAPVPAKVLVDVDGVETIGDGTGTLLRSLVDQRLHFMVNFVAPDPAWASGPYLMAGDTVFPHLPTIPLVDEASHTLVKAQLAARLASGDYEGATIIGASREFVTAVDALARFQLSGDFDQTFNRKGQDMVTCEPIVPGEDLPVITDVLSIRQSSFSLVDQVQSAFFNIIPYVHSRDYTGRERTGWYGNAEIRSDDSIANYDQEREAPRFELHAARGNTPQGAATIADVMARKLARYQDPRRIGTLQMPFEGLEYEPGSTALITHQEGIGAEGWVGREVRFIRHEVEPTEGIVRLDFYDLTAVLENHETLLRRRQASTTSPTGGTHEPHHSETRTETRTPDQRARRTAPPAPRRAGSPWPAR